jgi:hypothetical protein
MPQEFFIQLYLLFFVGEVDIIIIFYALPSQIFQEIWKLRMTARRLNNPIDFKVPDYGQFCKVSMLLQD